MNQWWDTISRFPDSDFHQFKKNKIAVKRAGCLRGGFDGTFIAAGYVGMVEMRFLRNRDRYRDWPSFQLLAASRQAKIMAYMSKEVAEQLHQQILIVESAVG